MRQVIKWLLVILILAVIALFFFDPQLEFNWLSAESTEESSTSSGFGGFKSSVLNVSAIIVFPKDLSNKITVTGEIIPNEYIAIKSEIAGIIQGIYFKEGQNVRKRQLLARINVDELLAERKKLEVTQQLHKTIEDRQAKLLQREAISQEEYDEALSELQTTAADINLINTQISKSEIRAPFSGQVGLRQISEGAYVTPAIVFAPLYSINPIKVEFAIPGKYSNEVAVGNKIKFSSDATDQIFAAEVYAIDSRVDPNTRTLTLRAICANQDRILLPGQFVKIELELSKKTDALMVPTESVIPGLEGIKLYRVKNGQVEGVEVTTGVRTEDELEILEGISEGDTILTSGILQANTGAKVKVKIEE